MPNLDNATQQELLALLSPAFGREEDRPALLARALGADCPVLSRIDCRGAVEPFVLRMVAELARFGEAKPGRQALWDLLETVRGGLDADLQARIDALEPVVKRPSDGTPALSATSALAAPGTPTHLRIFLASPGDVTQERGLALQVLDQIPYDPLLRNRVTIEAVAWDKPGAGTPMLATMTPQAAIAAGLPKPSECDIVVVILWSRMGTPLPAEYRKPDGSAYLSGTEWEYLDAVEASLKHGIPKVLVYRRTEEPKVGMNDPEFDEKRRQYALVNAFFATFRNADGSIRSGFNEYAQPERFARDLDLHLRAVINGLLQTRKTSPPTDATPATTKAPALWQGSPFPGLRAFSPDDAPIFFGRGRETTELLGRLAAGCRFVTVVGASGSGKSSLVAAGLIPRLKENAVEGSKDWLLPRVVAAGPGERKQWVGLRFTPGELGDDPFLALAAKLAPMLSQETNPAQLAKKLAASPSVFLELVDQLLAGKAAWSDAFMYVDQFEELLTVVAEHHREPFAQLLAAAATAPRMWVVVAMRADFYPRWLEQPRLPEGLRAAPSPLVAPGLATLFQMITGPAARAGLDLEDDLPARILDDTGSDSGALALLAFALHELYEARTPGGRLTLAAYEDFGGVAGAISRRAETTYKALPAGSQCLLQGVFRDLVDADERGVATRRRARRSQVASTPEAAELIDAFTKARLLVTDRGAEGASVVEVAHEALFREWPRLRDWIGKQADDLRLLRQAETAAAEWRRAGSDPSHFWPHRRLVRVDEALARLGLNRGMLDEPAKSFLRPEAERLEEELERIDLSHSRRAEIGDRLDRIGDPRAVGVQEDGAPEFVWREIPPGVVQLEDVEGESHVDRFFIALYPVTYRQYRAFLEDPQGYANKRWWEGLQHAEQPGEQYRPTDNCPAEHVSWYDALAYCRWASARLGVEVTLPTEWQWQQAATGGDAARHYPWGSEWEDGRANTDESRLSRTTAVGLYPAGATAQGVLDMAGNVWEWCLNKFDSPKDTSIGGDARRVVRGGSWGDDRDYARCANRFDYNPVNRYYHVGFRVVCVSPIR